MAAMTANPPVRRFFGQADAHSLKSFGANSPSSNPSSSLKANSLKTRKSLNILMPSLLSSKRGAQKGSPDFKSGVRREEINANAGNPPAVLGENIEGMPIRPRKGSTEIENHARQPNRPEGLQRSRSKTIMKMISTTFRANAPPSEPGCVPAPASDLASKANREAALRARGLLPPLKPNKDLSRLEEEQDQHLPVINLVDETVVAVDGDAIKATTAANLVKQEWEAKNRSSNIDPSSRMKSFKFGGFPSPSIMEQTTASTGIHTGVEAEYLFSSPTASQQMDEPMVSPPEDKPDVSGTPSPRNKLMPPPLVLDRHAIVENDYLLSPQSPATPYKNEPHLIPLPPSPFPSPRIIPAISTDDSDNVQISASFLLPASLDLPGTPRSLRITPPVISLSPPPSASLDGTTDLSHNESLPFTQPRFLSESESSETTPSLDNSSQTMTVSSLSTSESFPNTGKAKTNMLKVKVYDHHIPMIIESPVEETVLSKDFVLGSDISHEPSSAERGDEQQSASPQVRQGQAATPSSPATAKADPKKSKNPVKRGQTLDPSTAVVAKNRLSMLSSMRRSVVGSLSRSKTTFNTGGNKKTFNTSHLPSSPTIPASFVEQAKKYSPTRSLFPSPRRSDAGSNPPVSRVAAAPIIYSRGSILDEMKNIKDEETRRVTELAFLG